MKHTPLPSGNWKPIPETDNKVFVSDQGQIFSFCQGGKLRRLSIEKDGYVRVNVHVTNFISKKIRVHRLVATAFLPNPNNLPQVNHINGNKADNRVINLEWTSSSDNIKHAFANGLKHAKKGQDNCLARLTTEKVQRVKQLLAAGQSGSSIAREFGVHQTTICLIAQGKTWGHL